MLFTYEHYGKESFLHFHFEAFRFWYAWFTGYHLQKVKEYLFASLWFPVLVSVSPTDRPLHTDTDTEPDQSQLQRLAILDFCTLDFTVYYFISGLSCNKAKNFVFMIFYLLIFSKLSPKTIRLDRQKHIVLIV